MFISIPYMFRVAMCPSSGELIVSIRHLVYVTLYTWPFGVQVSCTLNGHLYRVTYTRCRIDTINSPDDGHMAARNMYRIEINIYEKKIVREVGYLQGIIWVLLYIHRIRHNQTLFAINSIKILITANLLDCCFHKMNKKIWQLNTS